MFWLVMGDGDMLFAIEDLIGREYCLAKAWAGGQARVDAGICLGIGTRERKSCSSISDGVIRRAGSTVRHLLMKSLAYVPIVMCSGNEKAPALIFLYVYLTSEDSKGGLPLSIVYRMTPIDQ